MHITHLSALLDPMTSLLAGVESTATIAISEYERSDSVPDIPCTRNNSYVFIVELPQLLEDRNYLVDTQVFGSEALMVEVSILDYVES